MQDTLWMLWRHARCNAQTHSECYEGTHSAMHRHCGFKRKAVVRSYNQHGPETLRNHYLWDSEFIFHGPQSKKPGFTAAAETPAAWALSSFSYVYFQNGPWPSWRHRSDIWQWISVLLLSSPHFQLLQPSTKQKFISERRDFYRLTVLGYSPSCWGSHASRNLSCVLAPFLHLRQSSTLAHGLATQTQAERPSTSSNPA